MSLFNMCARCPCNGDSGLCGSYFRVFIARVTIIAIGACLYLTSAMLVFDLL